MARPKPKEPRFPIYDERNKFAEVVVGEGLQKTGQGMKVTPNDVMSTMTRDEMARFLEMWGFKCVEEDSAAELAETVAHTCMGESIDLHQLHRLQTALNVAFSRID